jgi:hypothetical protein
LAEMIDDETTCERPCRTTARPERVAAPGTSVGLRSSSGMILVSTSLGDEELMRLGASCVLCESNLPRSPTGRSRSG